MICKINAHLFENASLKFCNDSDQNKLKAATSTTYKCSITNCMGRFCALETSNSLKKEPSSSNESWHVFVSGCPWVVSLPSENSPQTCVQWDGYFGCVVISHISHPLTVSTQDSSDLTAQGSPSLTTALVLCVLAFRVLNLIGFFPQYHSSTTASPRQTTHW